MPESFWTNERIGQRHDAIFAECRRNNLEPQAALFKCMQLGYTIAQDCYEELHQLRATIERLQAELAEAHAVVDALPEHNRELIEMLKDKQSRRLQR